MPLPTHHSAAFRSPDSPVVIIGGGIVGIATALHLTQRGIPVAVIDQDAPGRGTSFGNAGLIETSTLLPHPCPQDPRRLLAYALNLRDELRIRHRDLPAMSGRLFRYWRNSRAPRIDRIGEAFRQIMQPAVTEHQALAGAAGLTELLRPSGWLELLRDPAALERDLSDARQHGVDHAVLDRVALRAAEPDLTEDFAGAIHWRATVAITDPGGYVAGLARYLEKLGGTIRQARVTGLHRRGAGWRVSTDTGPVDAARIVLAAGPWSPALLAGLGVRLPMIAKRGYHRHFDLMPGKRLNHPVHVPDSGHLCVPTPMGVRVLTGIELARRGAPRNLAQMDRAESRARGYLPLGAARGDQPWLGARPCMPDMLPLIGALKDHPGLWINTGHGHHGMTQGPGAGQMLAQMMTGEAPALSPAAYAPARYGL